MAKANTKARRDGWCLHCGTQVEAGNRVRYSNGAYDGCQWCDYSALPVDVARAAATKAGWATTTAKQEG